MRSSKQLVDTLGLIPHPEGGYYKEVYRAEGMIPQAQIPDFDGDRNFSTSIYFLLPSGQRSLFHKIKSDELWFFHAGTTLSIYVIDKTGLKILKLGSDISAGEQYQHVVPANSWFGAIVDEPESFTLCSCLVAPGFDFDDFELAERNSLMADYPNLKNEIVLLTT